MGNVNRRLFMERLGMAGMASLMPLVSYPNFRQRNMKVLILGGTNYVGPHFVNQCLRRGYKVTLFNRGITNPNMFPYLEHIRGNRYPDIGNGLKGLQGNRKWDAVIDTWQGPPGCVSQTAELLKGRTGHYLYISSIAVYGNYREHAIKEDARLPDFSENINDFTEDLGYATRKRAAEQAALKYQPENATILRCGSIQGEWYNKEKGPTDFYQHHFRLGNTLLLPDDDQAKFQLIDVKDMVNFGIGLIEKQMPGIYNITGPETPLSYKDFIHTMHKATEGISKIYWVDFSWLKERGITPWDDIPHYIPMDDPEPGFYTISNQKAIGAGLTFRPVFTTIVESLGNLSLDQLRRQEILNGMSETKRLALIRDWEKRT